MNRKTSSFTVLFLFIAVVYSGAVFGAAADLTFDGDRAKEFVTLLSHDNMEGRLTEKGKAMIRAIEKAGLASIDQSLVEAMNRKNILIGVDLDPRKVDAFTKNVEAMKEK